MRRLALLAICLLVPSCASAPRATESPPANPGYVGDYLKRARPGMSEAELVHAIGLPLEKRPDGWTYPLPLDEDLSYILVSFERGRVTKIERQRGGCAIIERLD